MASVTTNPVSGTPRRMPKPRLPDVMTLRLKAGTFDRVDAQAGENKRGEWIRAAIEKELAQQERAARKPKPT